MKTKSSESIATKYNFMIVEDNVDTRENIESILRMHFPGSDVISFECGEPAMIHLRNAEKLPDLLYLDRMLPDYPSDIMVKEIREDSRYDLMSIVVVTAHPTETNEALFLNQGVDDYIKKPVSQEIFIARCKNQLEKKKIQEIKDSADNKSVIKYGDFVIDAPKIIASYKGQDCTLTSTEFKLLHFLAQNEGVVFSRDQLLTKVWGYEYSGDNRTVDVTVARTRAKIKKAAGKANVENCIVTRRGSGYSFDSSVFM